jgi:hypothetical protein
MSERLVPLPRELCKWGPKTLAMDGWKCKKGVILPNTTVVLGRGNLRLRDRMSAERYFRLVTLKGHAASPLNESWLASRGYHISKHHRDRYRYELEKSLPAGKTSRKYESGFESFRAWLATLRSLWGEQVPEWIRTYVRSWRTNFLVQPEIMSAIVKRWTTHLRRKAFGVETSHEWDALAPEASEEDLLQASAAQRALPAPMKVNSRAERKALKERLTSEPVAVPSWYEEWIAGWVKFHQPKYPSRAWQIHIGNTACLEYPRRVRGSDVGGVKYFVNQCGLSPLFKEDEDWLQKELKAIRIHCRVEGDDPERYKPSLELIAACVTMVRPFFEHARVCRGGCKKMHLHPIMAPIFVPERGFKIRVPTMSMAPLVILSKVLRSIADGFLRSDGRIAPSLQGVAKHPKRRGVWYRSPDLTTATDLNNPEATRILYREIGKYIDKPIWYDDVVQVICGYYTVVTKEVLDEIRRYYAPVPVPPPDDKYARMLMRTQFTSTSEVLENEEPRDEVLTLPYDPIGCMVQSGYVTKTGQPMGVATSWPTLPLFSIASYERALTSCGSPSVSRERRIVKRPASSWDMVAFTKWVNATPIRALLKREEPEGSRDIQTTGDDAVFSCSEKESLCWTDNISQLGGKVSETKDFLHRNISVYTEVIFRDGEELGIFPWAPLLAPRGVRKNTWYTQGSSLRAMEQRHKVSLPIKCSPFYPLYRGLAKRVAVSFPAYAGGLGLSLESPSSVMNSYASALRKKDWYEIMGMDDVPFVPSRDDPSTFILSKPPVKGDMAGEKRHLALIVAPVKGVASGPDLDLGVSTRHALSPVVYLSWEQWRRAFASFKTWTQLRDPPVTAEEPTIAQFLRTGPRPTSETFSKEDIKDILEQATADRDQLIELPLGALTGRGPTLGLIFPCTPIPVITLKGDDGIDTTIQIVDETLTDNSQ